MMVDDMLVVVGDAVSCDGGMVVSTDTVASVANFGGRGGDTGDSDGDGVRRMFGMLVLIDELVGSRDRPVAVDGGGVGCRGVHGPICVGYWSKPKPNQHILNADDILDASVVSCTSIDILNVDDILDASIVSCTSTNIA
ncbi:hypothetical protein FXO37_31466 [Capsicum annuum]|nr:hypothetical protein FXO37_31466 [Capsicum annuum]